MANLSNLNKLPIIQGFSLQLKMDRLKYRIAELVALFLLMTGTFSVIKSWRFSFRKGKGKYTVTLINRCYLILPRIQHKVVLLVL